MNDRVYFNNTQFWTEQWKAYDAGISAYRGYSNASTWNSMAAEYDKERHSRNIDERIDATFARLQNRGFECKGCRILDIGCGPGRYSREFARRGADVVSLDISDNMISRLKCESTEAELQRITPMVSDWKTLDLSTCGFEQAFDLVFANMTPAVAGPESFIKIQRASKKWCWFRSWAGTRNSPLLEYLHKALYEEIPEPFSGNFIIAWNLTCATGYFPDCEFENVSWTHKKPVDELIAFHTTFFRSEDNLSDSVREEKIRLALSEIANDGYIENKVTGHIGSMLWQVRV